jgi:hypothetical protein
VDVQYKAPVAHQTLVEKKDYMEKMMEMNEKAFQMQMAKSLQKTIERMNPDDQPTPTFSPYAVPTPPLPPSY